MDGLWYDITNKFTVGGRRMAFIKGKELCREFFFRAAKPLLDEVFPGLVYTAGLLGYGSDVLGYDDAVSTDHMWGPRFYLFLSPENIALQPQIKKLFAEKLPVNFMGYSVNFSEPDPNDCGVRHPVPVENGPVSPLIWIYTPGGYLKEYLGKENLEQLSAADWLAFSEHRLLALRSAEFYTDGLGMKAMLAPLRFYPLDVQKYLIASNWSLIAEEQAFVGRCAQVGDELGSRLACGRIAERLMRLCFLYCGEYAPYSKWFGTAFSRLPADEQLKKAIAAAVAAPDYAQREAALIKAQLLTAKLHNASGMTEPVAVEAQKYFGREMTVIFADRIVQAVQDTLKGTPLDGLPLLGSISEVANMVTLSDDPRWQPRIRALYSPAASVCDN